MSCSENHVGSAYMRKSQTESLGLLNVSAKVKGPAEVDLTFHDFDGNEVFSCTLENPGHLISVCVEAEALGDDDTLWVPVPNPNVAEDLFQGMGYTIAIERQRFAVARAEIDRIEGIYGLRPLQEHEAITLDVTLPTQRRLIR